jgi:hypothetical protein
MVQGSGFRVQGAELMVMGSGFRIQDLGFGVSPGSSTRIQGS